MNFSARAEVGTDTKSQLTDHFASRVLAYARQNATRKTYAAFGPATLQIETCGMLLSSIALDPLRHATTSSTTPADFHLVMIDGKETGIDGPALSGLALVSQQPRAPHNDQLAAIRAHGQSRMEYALPH